MRIFYAICKFFRKIFHLNIIDNRFRLHLDAVHRGFVSFNVRPHDYKE